MKKRLAVYVRSFLCCVASVSTHACFAGFFAAHPPTFTPGKEFPGASGAVSVEADGTLSIAYDFSKGGHYVGALCRLGNGQTVRSVKVEFSHDVDVRLTVRAVDATGQTFGKTSGILSDEWETGIWNLDGAGWMSWGGANDKVFHQPARQIDFLAENTTPDRLGGAVGTLRLRNVELSDKANMRCYHTFPPPLADVPLEAALSRARAARERLAPLVAKLEAKGVGAKSRTSLSVLDDFLRWIDQDCQHGKTARALREARELAYVGERAADRAEGILAGRIRDFAVPRYRLGTNVIDRAQVIGERVWPDGRTDRGPVFFTGFGHFQRVRNEVAMLPPLGFNVLQMEFGARQLLPTETRVENFWIENFKKDASRAQKANVGIVVLLSPHYWPEWTFGKWPDLKCGCYAGFCPYHPAAREVLSRYYEALLPKIRDSPALHSIVLTNEPSTRPNPKCPRVRAAFAAWLKHRHDGDIAAYNRLTGKAYASFADVPVPAGVDGNAYSVELADFVRFNREFFADWHRWMAERVRALAPGVPVHVKIQAHCMDWADSNPIFYSVEPVAYGRMSDYNGNDAVVSSEEGGEGAWCANWWDMEMAYDLQRTAVDKPIFNTENHFQRDRSQGVYQPGAHTYAALWQNALHGQNGSVLWCWERPFDQGKSDFNGLALERPEAMEAYGHCAHDLMRLAEDLAPLQNLPPRILLLWSTAYFLDGGRARFSVLHRAASFLGEPLGIVSEEMLVEYAASQTAGRPFDTAHVLLVPKTDRAKLPEAAQRALARFRAEGGLVLDDLPQREGRLFDALAAARAHWPGMTAPIVTAPEKPDAPFFGVETRTATRKGRQVMSLVNHLRRPAEICLPRPGTDLITGERVPPRLTLAPLKPMLVEFDAAR